MRFVSPMRLLRIPEPLDHADWVFEPKMDGFRALAHIRGHPFDGAVSRTEDEPSALVNRDLWT